MRCARPPFEDPAVERAFAAFPADVSGDLLELRRLIFETAAATPGVGRVEEALRWGQPAYLTPDTRSGSTLRLGVPKEGGFALYVHCRTTLIAEFRALFPDDFCYDGNRAVRFGPGAAPAPEKLALLIAAALTYRRARRPRALPVR